MREVDIESERSMGKEMRREGDTNGEEGRDNTSKDDKIDEENDG